MIKLPVCQLRYTPSILQQLSGLLMDRWIGRQIENRRRARHVENLCHLLVKVKHSQNLVHRRITVIISCHQTSKYAKSSTKRCKTAAETQRRETKRLQETQNYFKAHSMTTKRCKTITRICKMTRRRRKTKCHIERSKTEKQGFKTSTKK